MAHLPNKQNLQTKGYNHMTTQTSNTQPQAQELEKVVLKDVRVIYNGLNKADRFDKYGITIDFTSIASELQEVFEPIAYVNPNTNEKSVSIASYKELPATAILMGDSKKKFISKDDIVSIACYLTTATNGKKYPSPIAVKFIRRESALPNEQAKLLAELQANPAMLFEDL